MTLKSRVRDAIAAGAPARDALAAAVTAPKRSLTLGAVRDAARRGMSARDSLAEGLRAYAGAVTKASEMAGDDWSPEAREAAAKARKAVSEGIGRNQGRGAAARLNARANEALKKAAERGHSGKDAPVRDAHEGFAKLDHSLAHRKGVHNAAALAAWIGRKKMGKKAFQAKAAAGR